MTAHCPPGRDIAAYLEDALEPEARARLEAHLARCRRCAEEVEQLRPIADLLAQQACPPEEVRLAAALGYDDQPAVQAARTHLEQCPRCREERALVAHALEASVTPELAPASARPRPGAVAPITIPLSQVPAVEEAPPLAASAQLQQLELELRFAGLYSGLSVAVTVRDRLTSQPRSGLSVMVESRDGKERAVARTDENGVAQLSLRALRPTQYVMTFGEAAAERLSLEIGE